MLEFLKFPLGHPDAVIRGGELAALNLGLVRPKGFDQRIVYVGELFHRFGWVARGVAEHVMQDHDLTVAMGSGGDADDRQRGALCDDL